MNQNDGKIKKGQHLSKKTEFKKGVGSLPNKLKNF